MKVYCVLGDSNEYTKYTVFSIKEKITQNHSESADMGFFQRTQERIGNSHGNEPSVF